MNQLLSAVLPQMLGHDPECILTVKEGAHIRDDGTRPAFVYFNRIDGLQVRDASNLMRFTIRGDVASDADECVIGAALSAGKDVAVTFNRGFAAALAFLNAAYGAVECAA